jgi:hypothetical protein
VLEYLFALCEVGSENVTGMGSNEDGVQSVADPSLLVPLIFGDDRRTSGSGKKINNKKVELTNGPFANANIGSTAGVGGVLAKKQQNRSLVGTGPMRVDGSMTAFEGAAGGQVDTIPLRFVSRKSRTALATPASFNFSLAKRSGQLPNYECVR